MWKRKMMHGLCLCLSALWLACGPAHAPSLPDFQAQRETMVRQQIQARKVTDPDTLSAMKTVPRHLFVPKAYRASAYQDHPLPLGWGQTISQPYMVAVMTELLKLEPHHRVLEVGTGSGYQAAILSQIAAQVYSVEIFSPLAKRAEATLKQLGYHNVLIRHGDGYEGWQEHAPYDRIIITAAIEEVPPALWNQLNIGGILVLPMGKPGRTQLLTALTKEADGSRSVSLVMGVSFVPFLQGNEAERAQHITSPDAP